MQGVEQDSHFTLRVLAFLNTLLVEVPCFDGDTAYSMDAEGLARRAAGELDQVGIIERSKVIEWRHHFLPNAYPVYSLNYSDKVALIMRRRLAGGCIGYNSSDDAFTGTFGFLYAKARIMVS